MREKVQWSVLCREWERKRGGDAPDKGNQREVAVAREVCDDLKALVGAAEEERRGGVTTYHFAMTHAARRKEKSCLALLGREVMKLSINSIFSDYNLF